MIIGSLQRIGIMREKAAILLSKPIVKDPKLTFGQAVADAAANTIGSWTFVIAHTIFLMTWLYYNYLYKGFDPPPFIGLNLILSFEAAYSSSIILISANRSAKKDRELLARSVKLDQNVMKKLEALEERLNTYNGKAVSQE